jgi:hypothetical protein
MAGASGQVMTEERKQSYAHIMSSAGNQLISEASAKVPRSLKKVQKIQQAAYNNDFELNP